MTARLAERKTAGDIEAVLSLRYSSIISYTTLAQITYTLGMNTSPTAASVEVFRLKCFDALKSVISLVEELQPEEFHFLDPFMGVGTIVDNL